MALRQPRLILAMAALIMPSASGRRRRPTPWPGRASSAPRSPRSPTTSAASRSSTPGVGVAVRAVIPGSAAEEAGLKVGDVITAVDGTRIDGPARYVAKLGRRKAGERAEIAIVRGGKEQSMAVTLKARPREQGNDAFDVAL